MLLNILIAEKICIDKYKVREDFRINI